MRLVGAVVAVAGLILGRFWVVAVGAGLFALSYAKRSALPSFVAAGADKIDSLGNALESPFGNARGPLPAIGNVQTIGATASYSDNGGARGCGCAR